MSRWAHLSVQMCSEYMHGGEPIGTGIAEHGADESPLWLAPEGHGLESSGNEANLCVSRGISRLHKKTNGSLVQVTWFPRKGLRLASVTWRLTCLLQPPAPALCGVMIFPTAQEHRSLSSGWWDLPGSSLACRVPLSTSGFWLRRRFGLGVHFNNLPRWLCYGWHGPHLETLCLETRQRLGDMCLSWAPISKKVPPTCLWYHWGSPLPGTCSVLSWVWYSFNSKMTSYMLSSSRHILQWSTCFVMSPHLPGTRQAHDNCIPLVWNQWHNKEQGCMYCYTQQPPFPWSPQSLPSLHVFWKLKLHLMKCTLWSFGVRIYQPQGRSPYALEVTFPISHTDSYLGWKRVFFFFLFVFFPLLTSLIRWR